MAPVEYGSAADSLECGKHGHMTVQGADGRSRRVRGAFMPERRPFTGLTETIPASAGQVRKLWWKAVVAYQKDTL